MQFLHGKNKQLFWILGKNQTGTEMLATSDMSVLVTTTIGFRFVLSAILLPLDIVFYIFLILYQPLIWS